MRMSVITTSGRSRSIASSSDRTSAQNATTLTLGEASSNCSRPSRTRRSSSATTTLVGTVGRIIVYVS